MYIVFDSLKLRLLLCKLGRICQIMAASDEARKLDWTLEIFILKEQCSLCFLSLCTKLIVGSLCGIDFCSNRFEIFAFLAISLIFVYIHTLYESSCARFARNITVAGILCNEQGCHLPMFSQDSHRFVNFKELFIIVQQNSDWDSKCSRFFKL